MNYAYQTTSEGFSFGTRTTPLSPAAIVEQPVSFPGNGQFLSDPPFRFLSDATFGSIDWNRSGKTSGDFTVNVPLRAPATMPMDQRGLGCNASAQVFESLSPAPLQTPDIAHALFGATHFEYIFYVHSDGKIYFRSAPILAAPNDSGSCILNGGTAGLLCNEWGSEIAATHSTLATTVVAAGFGGKVYAAFGTSSGDIKIISGTPNGFGNITGWSPEITVSGAGVPVGSDLEFSRMYVNPTFFAGNTEVLALFWSTGSVVRMVHVGSSGAVSPQENVWDTTPGSEPKERRPLPRTSGVNFG